MAIRVSGQSRGEIDTVRPFSTNRALTAGSPYNSTERSGIKFRFQRALWSAILQQPTLEV